MDDKAQQPLPPVLKLSEQELAAFFSSCRELCLKLLRLFAIGLRIPEAQGGSTFFTTRHDPNAGPSGCTLRLLHYPSVPESAEYDSFSVLLETKLTFYIAITRK